MKKFKSFCKNVKHSYAFLILIVTAVGCFFSFVSNADQPSKAGSELIESKSFINNLGMEFVSVPSLNDIYFSKFETRVKDFMIFVKETNYNNGKSPNDYHEWQGRKKLVKTMNAELKVGGYQITGYDQPNNVAQYTKMGDELWAYSFKGQVQNMNHPVVNVSWNDAKAFCAWLSARDKDRKYRLPTDHEWSIAVGIGHSEGASSSPQAKHKVLEGYPWGVKAKPPDWSGNFNGNETDYSYKIESYTDGHRFTAPTGSYNLEHHGIKDLSGNVLEWCEDRFAKNDKIRVLRGGSWLSTSSTLSSSYRSGSKVTTRLLSIGFRCVCIVDSEAQ